MSDTETSSYITNLFPKLSIKDVLAGTAIYSSLGGSNITLAGTIMGECMIIFYLLYCRSSPNYGSNSHLPNLLDAASLWSKIIQG